MRKKKIALFQPQLIYPRGAERQISELAHQFEKSGNEVHLFTFAKKTPYQYDYLLRRVHVHSLNKSYQPIYSGPNSLFLQFFHFYRVQFQNILFTWLISKEIKKYSLDILNVHNYPGNWLAHFVDIPTIWTCNEPPYWYAYKISSFFKLFFLPVILLDTFFSRNIQKIFVLSQEIATIVKQAYNLPTYVLGSGANLIRKVRHMSNASHDILIVGELHEKKRPLDLLYAIEKLPQKTRNKIHLHFVGDGALKNEIIKTAKLHDIDVNLYGRASNEELYSLFDIADIAVFCPEKEPWGIFPIEACLAGIPLICSNEVGFLNQLDKKIAGGILIYEVGNTEELAIALEKTLEHFSKYKRLAMRNRKRMEELFSWKKLEQRYTDMIQF